VPASCASLRRGSAVGLDPTVVGRAGGAGFTALTLAALPLDRLPAAALVPGPSLNTTLEYGDVARCGALGSGRAAA
jgi:hypothetical protein